MKQLIESIFDAFFKEISIEDDTLRSLFQQNDNLYSHNTSYGLYIFYETTYVYLCLRGCLKNSIPARIAWEQPYKTDKQKHADLGVYIDDQLRALVEFKIWTREDTSEIIPDIRKYQSETEITSKWLIIIEYTKNLHGNEDYLKDQLKPKSILTRNKSTNVFINGRREDITLACYLIEV